MTVGEILRTATAFLDAKGVESPRLDAELLLGSALGLTRIQLYTEHDRPLAAGEVDAVRELVRRRGCREPTPYILGEWGFRRLTLKVDGRALIPRPETEVVVERCLALVDGVATPRVLDVGVGSGAIALASADEHPGARVTAVDASPDALALARENAARLGIDVELREGGIADAAGEWDLVVSNPPYVLPSEYDALQPEIREWEPRVALVGTGLHEELARRVTRGWLVLEVGDGQAPGVADALRTLGYVEVTVTRDLAGRERVVEGRRA